MDSSAVATPASPTSAHSQSAQARYSSPTAADIAPHQTPEPSMFAHMPQASSSPDKELPPSTPPASPPQHDRKQQKDPSLHRCTSESPHQDRACTNPTSGSSGTGSTAPAHPTSAHPPVQSQPADSGARWQMGYAQDPQSSDVHTGSKTYSGTARPAAR